MSYLSKKEYYIMWHDCLNGLFFLSLSFRIINVVEILPHSVL